MSRSINFEVDSTALDTVKSLSINANFDECKLALNEMLAPYKSLVVTEDSISSAKTDRASINKIESAIDEYRKSIKREWMRPLEEFEIRCKELTASCKEATGNIGDQIKYFDDIRRKEKLSRLNDYFDDSVGDMSFYISFKDIENPKWGNISYPEQTAMNDIENSIMKCREDIRSIKMLGSEFESELLDCYRTTHELHQCLKKNSSLIEMKRHEKERRIAEEKRRELEKGKTPEQLRREKLAEMWGDSSVAENGKLGNLETVKADSGDGIIDDKVKEEPIITIAFKVNVTKSQLSALKTFMNENGIKPMRV